MKQENFPTLEKVKDAVDNLKNKKFPKYTDGEDVETFVKVVADEIFSEFDFIINAKQPTKCNRPFLNLYRVRPYDTYSNIDLIREHSYPPLNVVGMGRCNFPKYPVFYCSNEIGTALLEVIRNEKRPSRKYCISKWQIIPSEEEFIVERFLHLKLPEENCLHSLNDSFSEKLKEPFEKEFKKPLTEDQESGLEEYFKYFNNCFIQDENYSLSATLAHRALYAPHNYRTDILIYPSVQSKFKGVNLALNPNFVENNLKLTRLYVLNFEVVNLEKGEMKVGISKFGKVEKNVVIWKTVSPVNEDYKKALREDFGEMLNSYFKKEE